MHKDRALHNLLTEEELSYLLASTPGESHQSEQSIEHQSRDNVLWETTITAIKQEIAELRTRVSLLEHELRQTTEAPHQYDDSPDQRVADHPEPNEPLSRVNKYKSQRGRWF